MSKKYKFIFSAIAVAFVAIIVGVCFVFFGNKAVYGTPESIFVEKYDGEYFVVAKAKEDYLYDFKIEQLINEKYVKISEVKNNVNTLKISEQNLTLTPGNKFRFSACYVSETGQKGEFSREVEWVVVKTLNDVDFESFEFDDGILTWDEVLFAQNYDITLINAGTGIVENLSSDTNFVDLSSKSAGNYTVYVCATNDSEFIENSTFGSGFEFAIE